MRLELVACDKKYWNFVRTLRNEEKNGFISTAFITEEMQEEYMKKYSSCYRIALINKVVPVGYVGVIENDIRVCVGEKYRQMGIGKFLIQECKKLWPQAEAKIKVENTASIKLFESCGYKTKYHILTYET